MKKLNNNAQRILTGIVGMAIMLPFFIFMYKANGVSLAIIVALISFLAVYEVINAVGCRNRLIIGLSVATAAVIPFLFNYSVDVPILPVGIAYCVAYFIIMVITHEKTVFSDVVISLFSCTVIPCAMSTLIEFRDLYRNYPDKFDKSAGIFFMLLGIICAWGTDTFAYAVGRRFGKHKLCEKISPKKSIEGAVGGVVGAVVLSVVLFLIFDVKVFSKHELNWWEIALISTVLSIISMFGDLSASIIKRNHNIKDFGKILPGHGGVMDRFDSCMFVFPSLYAALYFAALV